MEKKQICCSECGIRSCINCDVNHESGLPGYCLTNKFEEENKEAIKLYHEEENMKIIRGFLDIDGSDGIHGGQKTRVEMMLSLFENIGAKKIGIATCYALLNEARVLAKILRAHGFECYGVNCKVGTLDKEADLDVPADHDPYIGESSCNPILQAKILNSYHTDYNVILGLCMGHDALFTKYSEAPVSTLVVKDFALGHNSVVPLHMADNYYKGLVQPKKEGEN